MLLQFSTRKYTKKMPKHIYHGYQIDKISLLNIAYSIDSGIYIIFTYRKYKRPIFLLKFLFKLESLCL